MLVLVAAHADDGRRTASVGRYAGRRRPSSSAAATWSTSRAFHECAIGEGQGLQAAADARTARRTSRATGAAATTNAAYNVEPAPATFGIPASGGHIIDPPDEKIPYRPEALARRNELRGKGFDDPQAHCAPSGAPRKNITLFGWKIIQPAGHVLFLYESMHDYRIIPTDGRPHLPPAIKMWHGDPVGRWEGDTLVVDYRNLNGTPLVRHVGQLPEREHPRGRALHDVRRQRDPVRGDASRTTTIYTRPWTLAFALERNTEAGYYQLEYACHEGERDLQHLAAGKGR